MKLKEKYKFYNSEKRRDEVISENTAFEIIFLDSVETVVSQITGNEEIGNFIAITG